MELKITHLAGSDVSKTNGKLAGTTVYCCLLQITIIINFPFRKFDARMNE